MKKQNLQKQLSGIIPPFEVNLYQKNLAYAGMLDNPRIYAASKMITSFKISVVLSILSIFLIKWYLSIILFVFLFLALQVVFFIFIVLKAESRAREIEKVLPDALQLMSANVRAGMTIDKALWMSSRPEFGILEEELRKMASESLGGRPISEAFRHTSERINSKIFQRASMLIIQGIELGGSLAKLLVEVANDIRTSLLLQNEINAATSMYTLFIVFASIFASPVLFAVSTFYVQTTNALWSSQTQNLGENVQSQMGAINVSKSSSLDIDTIKFFALGSIIITTFCGALTIGLIRTGDIRTGIRYIPFFVAGGVLIYLLTYNAVSSALGTILSF